MEQEVKAGARGTTLIRRADRVVAWDDAERAHVYLTDADLVFADGKLSFVGRGYEGASEKVIDGRGLMVMPGLVDIHSHPSTEPMYRGLNEELGSPGLYNVLPLRVHADLPRGPAGEGRLHARRL